MRRIALGQGYRHAGGIAAAIVLVGSMAACGSSDSDSGSDGAASSAAGSASGGAPIDGFAGKLPSVSGSGKVGFAIYNGAVPHWNSQDIPTLKKCLQTYAPGYELISQDPKGDASTQTTQVQSMLAQDIKVLLLAPAAGTPTSIVNAAKQQKVPVINYANPVQGMKEGDIAALVGDGPGPIGTAQGKWILDQKYPKGTKLALINGDLATQYAQLMRTAQMEVLKPAIDSGDLVLVFDKGAKNWDGNEAQKLMAAVLVAHADVKAVIAGADFLAAGVINALKTQNLAGKVDIIGLDGDVVGAQNMLLGLQKATVLKSSINEATTACAALIPLLAGQPVPTDVFNEVWSVGTAPIPFKDTPVKTIEKHQLQESIEWQITTKDAMCKGLPASVGAPCA